MNLVNKPVLFFLGLNYLGLVSPAFKIALSSKLRIGGRTEYGSIPTVAKLSLVCCLLIHRGDRSGSVHGEPFSVLPGDERAISVGCRGVDCDLKSIPG